MIRNLCITKPTTIVLGPKVKSKQVVFINLGVSEISDNADYKFECYTESMKLPELNIESILDIISPEFLLLANNDEILTIMKAIEKGDDIDSWAILKTAQIRAYDVSSNVNDVVIDGIHGWYSKSDRVGLVNMYQNFVNKRAVTELPSLWFNGQPITLNTAEQALQILSDIEVYCYQCYNITQRHLISIQNMLKLNSLDALKTFNFTEHYPEKLNIKLE